MKVDVIKKTCVYGWGSLMQLTLTFLYGTNKAVGNVGTSLLLISKNIIQIL